MPDTLSRFDHAGHRDIGRLNGVSGVLGQRVGEVLNIGIAAFQRGRFGLQRLPDDDAENAGRHHQREDDDDGARVTRRSGPPWSWTGFDWTSFALMGPRSGLLAGT